MQIKKAILSILTFLILGLLGNTNAHATTWYVRDGGGNNTQCTGTTNAVYPGSGTGKPCAFNDLAWVLPPVGGNPSTAMQAGDTLDIVGDSDLNPGSQAQFMVGYGMANTVSANCYTAWTYQCTLGDIPAGPSSSSMTKVIGIGNHQPQIWGTQSVNFVINATNGNTDIENLELTDHSPCSYELADPHGIVDGVSAVCITTSGGSYPYGTYARAGLNLEGTNIITKNLFIHRFAINNIQFPGNVSNWSSTNDVIVGSGGGGALTGGSTMTFGGNNTMTNDVWAFGGCGEHYPDINSNPLDYHNYHHCADQTAGGYNLGGGFMMQNNGNAACGNWVVNNSQFLYNIKTNIDLLHCDGTGTWDMYRSRSEGSSGEALKVHMLNVNVEESQLIGNAPVWLQSPLSALWSPADTGGNPKSPSSYLICRGNAVTIFQVTPNMTVNYVNDDVTGNCTALLESSNGFSLGCSGVSINAYNTKFIGGYGYDIGETVDLYYDGSAGGTCSSTPLGTLKNNSCYNAASYGGYSCSSGTNTVTADPKVTGESSNGSLSTWLGPTSYYNGTNLGDLLYLQSSSPLIGAGTTTGVTYTNDTSKDFNGATANSPITVGALQNTSCAANGWFGCYQNSDCCAGTCSNNVCTGGALYGDVTGSGQVTIADAELTAQEAVGISVSNFNSTNAEVDGTGKVDIYDAYLIAEYVVGLISKFPIQLT